MREHLAPPPARVDKFAHPLVLPPETDVADSPTPDLQCPELTGSERSPSNFHLQDILACFRRLATRGMRRGGA